MAYSITNQCVQCDACLPQCPTHAIQRIEETYWIDPEECNNCQGVYNQPHCLSLCPVDSPIPFQAKKGRYKSYDRPALSLDLFLDGKRNSFASALVIWEACNILAQRRSLPWHEDESGGLMYQRHVGRGRGLLTFRLGSLSDTYEAIAPLPKSDAEDAIAQLDIRAACLHLIYAAHATQVDQAWSDEFVISDRQIEQYLGLDKRKDISKLEKLKLIKQLALQPCQILAEVDWTRQGNIAPFSLAPQPIWQMIDIQHHFEEDRLGCNHLVGLTFRVKAGAWSQYFLNQQGAWHRTAFYQYGHLPISLLPAVMGHWQQHEGATRLLLWLLFKTKMGYDQPVTVQKLMRVAYGEEKIGQACAHSALASRLIKTFENDLATLTCYGIQPAFDPETYPQEIQPLWAKLADIPDDAEAALEFWMEDGSQEQKLTDAAPRGKWKRLLNARLLKFELPETWDSKTSNKPRKRQQRHWKSKPTKKTIISGDQIVAARKRLQLSQRALAEMVGKSQSWIRDIENGRFELNAMDQGRLEDILKID